MTLHTSVMLTEILEYLIPKSEQALLIDCTLGEGGHTKAFLSRYPTLDAIGIDRDQEILERAIMNLAEFKSRFTPVNAWFDQFLSQYEGKAADFVLFDLGISMFHYLESGRGFSFQKSEALDMRLAADQPLSVATIVNTYNQDQLANTIYYYGEERYSRQIARAIIARRHEAPITDSKELADIIYHSVPRSYRYGKIHPATRTFQALRIAVNRELDRIEPAIEQALRVVKPGGRIAVISFHSLEDRPVKHLFRRMADEGLVKVLTKKPLIPSEEECQRNPASRSAKLRIIEKLEVENE